MQVLIIDAFFHRMQVMHLFASFTLEGMCLMDHMCEQVHLHIQPSEFRQAGCLRKLRALAVFD